MRALLLPIAVLVLLAGRSAHAIGNRTHAEIGERSVAFQRGLDRMLPGIESLFASDDNLLALYSGCTFPDWGYGNLYPDAGEDAHWHPFHESFFSVINESLQRPWSAENEQAIAFFSGVISHSISDLPWHFNSGRHRSFIATATEAENSGHTECDTGSDMFIHQIETLSPDFGMGDWYWPVEMLYDAYERSGRVVSRVLLRTAETRQRAVVVGGAQWSKLRFASWKERSPWVLENMNDYYFGGLNNGAAASAMWIRYYFARFKGWHYFQNMPEYGGFGGNSRPYSGAVDTTLSERHPTHNAGGEPFLEVSGRPDDRRHALLRFDLRQVPSETRIARATMWLNVSEMESTPVPVLVRGGGVPWSEGAGESHPVTGVGGRIAADEEVSWARYEAANAPAAAAGEAETDPAGLRIVRPEESGEWVDFDVTELVQSWIRDPDRNYGLALSPAPFARGWCRFFSSEAWKEREDGFGGGTRVNYRPVLVLVPEGAN